MEAFCYFLQGDWNEGWHAAHIRYKSTYLFEKMLETEDKIFLKTENRRENIVMHV
jgi:hypothetical protein